MRSISELITKKRLLLGPGPSDIDYRVLRAMVTPVTGYMDKELLGLLDKTSELLRYVFQTSNELTLAISGSGTAGMEASLVNLIEKGDRVVVGVSGYFSERICKIAARCGGEVIRVDSEWGRIVEPEQIIGALKEYQPKLVFLVHGETSTGVLQPIAEIGKAVRENGSLLGVDTVASLGGVPFKTDAWLVDVVYSGTQKCLGAPPGMAPITINDRARDFLKKRQKEVPSFYLDLNLIWQYWGSERIYHHTPPISLIYGLYEALCLINEEGLDERYKRHSRNSQALIAGMKAMGFEPLAQEAYNLPTLNAIKIPPGINEATIRSQLLNDYNIEIVGGLGHLAGKIWRIGLMGTSSTKNNVLTFLAALESILQKENYRIPESGVSGAIEVFDKE